MALVVVSAAMWWWPSSPHESAVLASAPASALAGGGPGHGDVCSASSAAPIKIVAPALPAPALRLEGTVMAGSASFAMVRRTTDSRLLQLRVGDRIDGLVVTEIESSRIALAGASQRIVIESETRAPDAAPAAPANTARPVPPQIPAAQLAEARGGPAPEDEVGH
jgi:hypothetical protein